MKKLISSIVLLVSLVGHTQGENNFWYFGHHCGLDFNTGNPIALFGGTYENHGSASISNAQGELLFYTDGGAVWNKKHYAMNSDPWSPISPNLPYYNCHDPITIVPKPNSPSIYYIFTLFKPTLQSAQQGICYTEIDMTLKNGLGGITANKSIPLVFPIQRVFAFTENANCDGYWLLTHGEKNNSFMAFSITALGINNTPIISNIGIYSKYFKDGKMKFSPDGKKLLYDPDYTGAPVPSVSLFDFDLSTGIVTNEKKIYNAGGLVEFSPSGNVLYAITRTQLLQFNLLSADISNSKTEIHNSNFHDSIMDDFADIQLGPNGKIYTCYNSSTWVNKEHQFLGVIKSPEVLGLGCNFEVNSLPLKKGTSTCQLPQLSQSFFNFFIDAQYGCFGEPVTFLLNSNRAIEKVKWDFGDGSSSEDLNPTHQYATPGKYTVSVTASVSCKTVTKTKTVDIVEGPKITNPIADQYTCISENTTYDLSQFNDTLLGSLSKAEFGIAYFSTKEDIINHQNILPNNQTLSIGTKTFYAKVFYLSNPNCYAITSFRVNTSEAPKINKPEDIFVCDDVSNDGKEAFNLQNQSKTILGLQDSEQCKISFHKTQDDANTKSNSVPLNYSNTDVSQTIYARVEKIANPNCFATTSFQIGVNKMPAAYQPKNLYLCDDEKFDEKEIFDLTSQTSEILGNQSDSDFQLTYHLSQNDADSNQNAITVKEAFTNTTNPQTIYARIENKQASTCFSTINFQLIIHPKPNPEIKDSYLLCEGENIKINAPKDFSSYLWSDGSTGTETTITKAGNYSLTVTKDYETTDCSTTEDFVVKNSNAATIIKINTKDWTDNQNSIAIEANGDGNYEYSIDGINYQDSPIFNDVASGSYTIYVNDKNGCGLAMEEVFLLTYPKFFSPNGDGNNDYWEIKFSYSEPQMLIYILDRHGKLLAVLSDQKNHWNGTYNENPLPPDDYWFIVKRQSGKEYKGHFSLRR